MEELETVGKKPTHRESVTRWKAIVAKHEQPDCGRASWQLLNTVGTYAALWYFMYLSLSVSWWLTASLTILAGGVLVRIFIIFHDCCHRSFFKSRLANNVWGFFTGLLTFTPYYHWRWEHSIHHASAGHLDRRGVGDVWTLTVNEYIESPRRRRFFYRLVRNPFFLFGIAPLFFFLIGQRIPARNANPRETRSVWVMNFAIIAMSGGLIAIFGVVPWLVIQISVLAVAGSCGVWLFYVQHQFEDAYWERGEDWDYTAAALQGSSFYKLPRILQWFSGNIGYHHIHHLSPGIPNYNLERCHHSDPMFQEVKPMLFFESLKSIRFRLWDEEDRKLVGFGHLSKQRRKKARMRKSARSSRRGSTTEDQPHSVAGR